MTKDLPNADDIDDLDSSEIDRLCAQWGGWGGAIYEGSGRCPPSTYSTTLAPDIDRVSIMLVEAETHDLRAAKPHEVTIDLGDDGTRVEIEADDRFIQLRLQEVIGDDGGDAVFAIRRDCPECHGTGEVDLSVGPERVVDCDECGGTGTVPGSE